MSKIFPVPVKEEYRDGFYTLKETSKEESLFDFYNKVKEGNADITYVQCAALKKEGYELCAEADGVVIQYADEAGKFRALTTLRQLIEDGKLPFVSVLDYPQFENRGYMLDISGGRMPKVETITWLIDLLADLKYNELQLYMDSFVFKYDAFPEYTADFDCLTPEDIEYLDQYCYDRFIELVPNQNGFGHMEAWLDYPEFKHLALTDGTNRPDSLNPLLDESLEFVDKLYGSLLPHFRSKRINIGLDEVTGLGKYQSEEACKEFGIANVFMDYMNKLTQLCEKKYGKTVMFWSDMITKYPEVHSRIPKNAVALNWGYDLITSQLMEGRCIAMKELNVPFYVCPGNSSWLSFTGRFDVMSFNTRTLGEVGREHGAIGYLMTDWSSGDAHMHNMVWGLVPAALAGQYAWNVGAYQNGGTLKNDYIYAAQDYIDRNVFGGVKVSRLLYRIQQYYLYEPERLHSSSMCCLIFKLPLDKTEYPGFFDLKKCGDDFYFDNVIEYMKKNLDAVKNLEFDERWKREIKVNANMVIMATELLKVRMHQKVSPEQCEYLCNYIDEIAAEHKELWLFRNYEKGIEIFLGQLEDKKQQLRELCAE